MKPMKLFLILLSFLILPNVHGQTLKKSSDFKYQQELKRIMDDLVSGKKITIEQILISIPRTQEEFGIFYSYTEREEKYNVAFYKLSNITLDQVKKKNKNIFKSYLLLSQFVDGEYAESYFDDIESLIEKDKQLFCEIYSELPKEKLTRLKDYYKMCCK
jgi:hypothetical protein